MIIAVMTSARAGSRGFETGSVLQAEAVMYDKFSAPARFALDALLKSISTTITEVPEQCDNPLYVIQTDSFVVFKDLFPTMSESRLLKV